MDADNLIATVKLRKARRGFRNSGRTLLRDASTMRMKPGLRLYAGRSGLDSCSSPMTRYAQAPENPRYVLASSLPICSFADPPPGAVSPGMLSLAFHKLDTIRPESYPFCGTSTPRQSSPLMLATANYSEGTLSVPHRILCAYDESAAADRAFELALKLAGYFSGELYVLSVLQPPEDATGVRPDVLRKSAETTFAPAFVRLQARAEAAGCPLSCVAAIGFPWQQILAHAEQLHAEHIIMGHRGRNGFRHATAGSVSQKVVARAAVPVTVVP